MPSGRRWRPSSSSGSGCLPGGNAQDPQGEFRGRNVLYVARDLEDLATSLGRPVDEIIRDLRTARQRLYVHRRERPRPRLDDKVLTAWNGLMIAAFARAARQLRSQSPQAATWLRAAERAAQFLRDNLWDANRGALLRRWRAGHAAIDAYAEDYAYLAWGLLELFEATGDASWLEWARDLQAQLDDRFWDDVAGGWFSTTGDDPSVLLRMKEDYDGAEPAASSVAVGNLLRLVHLAPDATASARIERTLARGGLAIGQAARAVPHMLANLATYHAGLRQVVIVGPPDAQDTQALHDVVARHYLPFTICVPVTPGHAQARLTHLLPVSRDPDTAGSAGDGVRVRRLCLPGAHDRSGDTRTPAGRPAVTDLDVALRCPRSHHLVGRGRPGRRGRRRDAPRGRPRHPCRRAHAGRAPGRGPAGTRRHSLTRDDSAAQHVPRRRRRRTGTRSRDDAALFADLPVDVVTGYVRAAADGSAEIDEAALALVAERVPRARITVHRAIERISGDPAAALRRCPAVDRVLSGGGAGSWAARAEALVRLQAAIAPVRVIVGGGVSMEGIDVLAPCSSLRELHVGAWREWGSPISAPVDAAHRGDAARSLARDGDRSSA